MFNAIKSVKFIIHIMDELMVDTYLNYPVLDCISTNGYFSKVFRTINLMMQNYSSLSLAEPSKSRKTYFITILFHLLSSL